MSMKGTDLARSECKSSVSRNSGVEGDETMYRATYCAHTSPLPLLPSGPGGVGGIESRRTRHTPNHTTWRVWAKRARAEQMMRFR